MQPELLLAGFISENQAVMFQGLSEKLESAFKNLKGEARINDLNIANTIKDIRRALIDADVNFKIAKEFTEKVRDKAVGQKVINAVSPGQLMVKIVQDELTNDVALAITDFATDETLNEKTKIWDNQITYLLSVIGA